MTNLLEEAVATARLLPPAQQDELAQVILAYASEGASVIALSEEELADLDASDKEIERGEFATDEEVQATLSKRYL